MRTLNLAVVTLIALALASVPSHAAAAKTYQVTGPVLSVTADTIVVQKGEDKWEISRDAATRVTGDLAVGSQVTIQYRMAAVAVEVKAPKGDARAPAKSKSKS